MSADTLSDVLEAVRLKSAVFFDVDTSAPWAAETPNAAVIGPAVMPGAGHVIEYHVLASGTCWAAPVDFEAPPVLLRAGDVVAFPHGDAHVMSSAPGLRGEEDLERFRQPDDAEQLPFLVNLNGGGAERAHLVCGFLGCDARPFNPLLDALPRILHLRSADDAASRAVAELARLAVKEAKDRRAGSGTMLSRLGELMFVELVRRYVETLPADSSGWLAGLRDRHVGRALNLLHGEPRRAWTLDMLARETGLSRSSLVERFSAFAGAPPMQYLQKWRLQLAARQLADSSDSIATVAERAGYDSEAAFSRAFRKMAGMPPAAWRNAATGKVGVRAR
ncbi:MAG: AraC family transcriptional regulator [Alphaproteobacteria bacterium 64-11]|nr:AraC family transcriptional regulator [Alphaproteobacteria bacterium]OJU09492.1 MAG: AraC family transcriptional regulator [Alphaproteobacteria bacterium 64-11]